MRLGGAFYCEECGAEISGGDYCSECDADNGVAQVTYTFLAFEPDEGVAGIPARETPAAPAQEKPWWKIW